MRLPDPSQVFPANTRVSIVRFWAVYWAWFLVLLPFMLLRQVCLSLVALTAALWTWNRRYDLLGGDLRLRFLARGRTLIASLLFGERFLAVHHRDVLIDPGPRFAQRTLRRHLEETGPASVRLVAITHFHEEHIGTVAEVTAHTGAAHVASAYTLERMGEPLDLSLVRRWMIGQPPVVTRPGLLAKGMVVTRDTTLQVIEAPGHCAGHVAYYDPDRQILFAGDAYLHDYFSSPNADVCSDEWIATIERFLALDIAVLVGCHGVVYARDAAIPTAPFVVVRADPRELLTRKLDFLRWSRAVVAEGERRGLPYSVIEACVFAWPQRWTWGNWFNDEAIRLFSFGEFSRTHFIRSLSRTPAKVPPRFPCLVRCLGIGHA